MVCGKFNNKWETASKVNKCPFCGAYLSIGAEGTTFASVLIIFINQNGLEIL